jgi:hypothetical protein
LKKVKIGIRGDIKPEEQVGTNQRPRLFAHPH